MVAHAPSPTTWEVQAEGTLHVWGQSETCLNKHDGDDTIWWAVILQYQRWNTRESFDPAFSVTLKFPRCFNVTQAFPLPYLTAKGTKTQKTETKSPWLPLKGKG